MKTFDEIKQLMAAGDTAQADEALKELLSQEPDNLQAKMLYGTCRQLLGDEETFRRIHDDLAPVMEKRKEAVSNADEAKRWERFDTLFRSQNQDALCVKRKPVLMEYVVIAVLIIAAIAAGAILLRDLIPKDIMNPQKAIMNESMRLYAGPEYYGLEIQSEAGTVSDDTKNSSDMP